MENWNWNSQVKRRPSIGLSLFTTPSESFSKAANSTKSPRNFFEGGVVGLGIVAAMTNCTYTHTQDAFFSVSPRSTPIPIPIPVVSSPKPAASFLGGDRTMENCESEGYTCVISHFTNNTIQKRIYLDDRLSSLHHFPTNTASALTPDPQLQLQVGIFSASPLNAGGPPTHFWSADFLNSCYLCSKQLHGVDIFMYRGERAFCSAECRETHIRNDDYQEKCKYGATKLLDCSMSPCSGPPVSVAGIVAA